MKDIPELIAEAAASRREVINAVRGLTATQAGFKPTLEQWSLQEQVEHLVLAELSGLDFMWRAAEGLRSGTPVWSGEAVHEGLPVAEVVAKTWKPREKAPPGATPSGAGTLAYWIARLEAGQSLLETLQTVLEGLDLSRIVYPHYLSGPLDARQRLEFLSFHMDRHLAQIQAVKSHPDFPSG